MFEIIHAMHGIITIWSHQPVMQLLLQTYKTQGEILNSIKDKDKLHGLRKLIVIINMQMSVI